MGKLIFGINLTIDGCCDHTKGGAYEDVHEYFAQQMREASAVLYGRKTYELMVPFWPDMAISHTGPETSISDFAHAFNSVGKIIVCSTTLGDIDDARTTILIRSNTREAITRLKQEETGIILAGGVNLPGQLIQWGLVDELRIVVQPLIAGAGRRLWDDVALPESMGFTLVDTKQFPSGCVVLHYMVS